MNTQLWDIVGVDGLQVMKSLFGSRVDRIAPFQSLEAQSCSILRLCEGNFRIAWCGESTQFEEQIQRVQGHRVWIKRSNNLTTIVLPESSASKLTDLAIPKPPHRIDAMPLNCAIPARIGGIAVLIWKHPLLGQPCFELQSAIADREILQAKLSIEPFSMLENLQTLN